MRTLRHNKIHDITFINKDSSQKVCLTLGFALIILGLIGTVSEEFIGLHLNNVNKSFYLLTGILAIWFGSQVNGKNSFYFCVFTGAFYIALGIVGFSYGVPELHSLGDISNSKEQFLLKLIPNKFELGSMDHTLHIITAILFLFAAVPTGKASFED
ncbi:MAG: hypothetical protein ACOYL6_16440 [Bacteriovoracaceae bacterium]